MLKIRLVKSGAGFTLIELLVVIAIISLLASVVLISLNAARIKARDARRIADINQMSKAMELYAADNNGLYPATEDAFSTDGSMACVGPVVLGGPTIPAQVGCGWCNRWCWLSDVLKPYISKMPKDPLNNPDTGHFYYYTSAPSAGNKLYGFMSYYLEDSGNIAKYSNPAGTHPTGYELGPAVNYCAAKYTGANANWVWNVSNTTCVGGN